MRTPIRHAAADGTVTWWVRCRRFDEAKGRKVESSETFEDEDAAWRFSELMARHGRERALTILRREATSSAMTLDDWFARWNSSRTGIEDYTRERDRRMYERRWKPELGSLPLDLIDREAVASVVNAMSRAGAADKTVRNYHGLLSACLNAAVEENLIGRNPVRRMRLPRTKEPEEMRFLTTDEFWQLHDAMPEHWRPLLVTLVGTGIRWSEAEALTIADVLPSGKLRINKAAKGTGRTIGVTKSRMSRRTITLPAEVVAVLRPLVADRPRTARLFTAPRGGPIRHRTFWHDVWRKRLAAAGLDDPQPRIHDLRHTHASWLIARGVPLPVIQRRLGHKSITTTIDRYGHLLPDVEAAAADAASAALTVAGD